MKKAKTIPKNITELIKVTTEFKCEICGEDDLDDMVGNGLHLVKFEGDTTALICPNCAEGLERLLVTTIVEKDNELLECIKCSLRFQCYTTRSKELAKGTRS